MNKFWTILAHTYMTKVKTKSFIISTIITILFIFGISNIQSIIDVFTGDENEKVAVIDETGELFVPLETTIEATDDTIEPILYEDGIESGKKAVKNDTYEGLLELNLDDEQIPEATLYMNTINEAGIKEDLENILQQLKVTIATQRAGIDEEQLQMIYEPISFETTALDDSAKSGDAEKQTRGIVYAMVILMFMIVMLYGTMIATDVATEKSSRVMEILISSASPVTHLFAKIIGMTLLGLTQIVIFIGAGYAMIHSKMDEMTGGVFEVFGIEGISVSLIMHAILFFLLGYLLYATLAAMLGSLVSRVEEVNQLIMPMTFLLLIGFYIAMFGMGFPDSTIVTITSYIPFFTPMVMFLRIGMLNVPVWEMVLSYGILVASIIVLGAIGARIYKGGVLMYGKTSSFKDIKKAIALSRKE